MRCAWFPGMDGQRSENEVMGGRPALRRDIPGAHCIELSYPSVLVGQVSLMQRIVHWQKHFMKEGETDFALSTFQHWEYSLVKIAVGCVTDQLFLNYSRQISDCARQQRQQEKQSQSYKLSKLRSAILRHNHVADLDSTLHLSLHQLAAFITPGAKLRPYHDVDGASCLASLTCNDKARFIFNISPKKMIPQGIEDLGFHIKVRAVQGHSSLPRDYDPSALGVLLDIKACSDMGYIFHASSNVNYDSINSYGLVLSPFSHGLGQERGRVGVRFVYAGGVTPPRHGTVIRGHSLLEPQLSKIHPRWVPAERHTLWYSQSVMFLGLPRASLCHTA